ncbi:transposase IS66 [Sphingobium sp. TKS]|nr:transposase IS66 [Sphingobium sp. TKS]
MGNEAQAEIDSLRERLAAAEAVAAEVARIKAINADLEARNALLELQNEKMRRTLFGQRSERTRHLLDQMELTFEECETAASEEEFLAALAAAKTNVAPFERKRPARKALPEHLPRERVVIAAPDACPCCGSERLCKLGEDITETLEVVPRQWKVVQTVREKFSCRDCEKITQPPAPFHVTPRGLFGPSFLAMLLFEKFGAHQPLNRQRDRYAREGVDLSLSTLADQVGTCAAALMPLYLLIEAHVLAAERLHGDDTTVPVLAKTKTDTGRIWTYVRDDRPFGGPAPPAAIFHYSRDRRGEHPVSHLRSWRGILQADAYAGYNALFHGDRLPAPLTRALCWSHYPEHGFIWGDAILTSGIGGKGQCGSRDKIIGTAGTKADPALASKAWPLRVRYRRASKSSVAHRASSSGSSRYTGSWSRCWNDRDNRGSRSRRCPTAGARRRSCGGKREE